MEKIASTDLDREKTAQSAHETLSAGLETVKSVAHAAKQKLHLHSISTTGPSRFFHPTNVQVHFKVKKDGPKHSSDSTSGDDDNQSLVSAETLEDRFFLWRARDSRKGHNPKAVHTSAITSPSVPLRARFEFSLGQISANIWKMMTTFAYWDMAFWSGWSYTFGSALFVIDGGWAFGDVAFPGSVSDSLLTYGAPLCFFFGAVLYQIGAVMAYLEAVNDGSFHGSAMRRFMDGTDAEAKKMLDDKIHNVCSHLVPHMHHRGKSEKEIVDVDPEAGWRAKDRQERPGSIYPDGKAPAPRRGGIDYGEAEEGFTTTYTTWRWYPSWHALKTRHVYQIGYVACTIQLFGVTLYGVTGVVDLPGILDGLSSWQTEAAFWIPQIVASVCFLVASMMFTLETQVKWYKPEFGVVGWWIGFWACVGSVGFLLCAIFGTASYDVEWGEYQADLSSMWGSAGYLISSLLQWYEAINKHPVDELFNEPGEMKSSQIHPI